MLTRPAKCRFWSVMPAPYRAIMPSRNGWKKKAARHRSCRPAALARAEVRRLSAWFDDKFYTEVRRLITYEKIDRRFMGADDGGGGPDMATVRVGLHNLDLHLEYLTYLLQTRDWLAGGFELGRFCRRGASFLP